MARNRSELEPETPEGWPEALRSLAHLIADDLTFVYTPEQADYLAANSWRPDDIGTAASLAWRSLNIDQRELWWHDMPATRIFVSELFTYYYTQHYAKKSK
jgi:hypothetical protein